MADALTSDELVTLAEFEGKGAITLYEGENRRPVVFTNFDTKTRVWTTRYEPHKDASQRDELVEASVADGIGVEVDCDPEGFFAIAHLENEPFQVDAANIKGIGLAVCRAVLQAIQAKGKP